jgi:hypothetical protein
VVFWQSCDDLYLAKGFFFVLELRHKSLTKYLVFNVLLIRSTSQQNNAVTGSLKCNFQKFRLKKLVRFAENQDEHKHLLAQKVSLQLLCELK